MNPTLELEHERVSRLPTSTPRRSTGAYESFRRWIPMGVFRSPQNENYDLRLREYEKSQFLSGSLIIQEKEYAD
ncbi:hypothetical protein CNMCM5793_009540 [Aspergillus hiratsukae]|uniref:Uncharacterized protein n=1 Tax=Aspergillus hiratsukae TaxID=1194566 RepID=A0A8H6UFL3_9EURO|nr:hypothetical protein CNMCM5793_009540 [Aspergillus hiratsukae]KAF7172674.1 hypothetical protein CNMCM6106_006841 [Aspergillus hiratsukae]